MYANKVSSKFFWPKFLRYKDDVYDRVWKPYNYYNWTQLSTNSVVVSSDDYNPAESVMTTASTPQNSSESLYFYFETLDPTSQFYFYLYFAEVEELRPNQTREFDIYLNGKLWFGPVNPRYLNTTLVHSTAPVGKGMNYFWVIRTENSTLPPILNAIEVYTVKELLQSQTTQSDGTVFFSYIFSFYEFFQIHDMIIFVLFYLLMQS